MSSSSSEAPRPRLDVSLGQRSDGTVDVFISTAEHPVKNGDWQTGPYTLEELRAFAKEIEDTLKRAARLVV